MFDIFKKMRRVVKYLQFKSEFGSIGENHGQFKDTRSQYFFNFLSFIHFTIFSASKFEQSTVLCALASVTFDNHVNSRLPFCIFHSEKIPQNLPLFRKKNSVGHKVCSQN